MMSFTALPVEMEPNKMIVTYRDDIGGIQATDVETVQILNGKVYIDCKDGETSVDIDIEQLVSIESEDD